jgi:hypothetical protein
LQGCHGSMSLQGCHGYMSLQGCHGSMSYHRTFLKGSACSECFIISQQKHAGPLPPHSTLHTRTHTHTHTHTHTAGRKHDCGQRLSGKRDVSSSYPGVMFHQPCLSHWLSYQSWCLKFVPRCDVSSAVSKSLIVSSVVMSQVRTQVWCIISRVSAIDCLISRDVSSSYPSRLLRCIVWSRFCHKQILRCLQPSILVLSSFFLKWRIMVKDPYLVWGVVFTARSVSFPCCRN